MDILHKLVNPLNSYVWLILVSVVIVVSDGAVFAAIVHSGLTVTLND